MKALILRLFGATFEVRRVNAKLGKDLPGTCLHKGPGYRAAKKAYVAAMGKAKVGELIRLQAVLRLNTAVTQEKVGGDLSPKPADKVPPTSPEPSVQSPQESPNVGGDFSDVDGPLSHPEEPVGDLFPAEHQCDFAGPLTLVNGRYTPSCSICGKVYAD